LDLGKFHPRKVNEVSEVGQSTRYILSLTLGLDGGGAQHTPAALPWEGDLVSNVQRLVGAQG